MERLDSSQNTPQDIARPVDADMVDLTETVDLIDTALAQRRPSNGGSASTSGEGLAAQAQEQVRVVAEVASEQTKGVLSGIGEDLSREVEGQKERFAQLLREIGDELQQAAESGAGAGSEDGRVARFAESASVRTREFAYWLESHRSRDLVDGVNDFARRRPVTFIAASALTGVLVGRLTRGIVDSNGETRQRGSGDASAVMPVGAPLTVPTQLDDPAGLGPQGWAEESPIPGTATPGTLPTPAQPVSPIGQGEESR